MLGPELPEVQLGEARERTLRRLTAIHEVPVVRFERSSVVRVELLDCCLVVRDVRVFDKDTTEWGIDEDVVSFEMVYTSDGPT